MADPRLGIDNSLPLYGGKRKQEDKTPEKKPEEKKDGFFGGVFDAVKKIADDTANSLEGKKSESSSDQESSEQKRKQQQQTQVVRPSSIEIDRTPDRRKMAEKGGSYSREALDTIKDTASDLASSFVKNDSNANVDEIVSSSEVTAEDRNPSRRDAAERGGDYSRDALGTIGSTAGDLANSLKDVVEKGPAAIIDGDGFLNPENWAIVGKTEKTRERDKEKEEHRQSNPMPDGSMSNGRTSGDVLSGYEEFFNKRGGLESGYETGLDQIGRTLASGTVDERGNYIPSPTMVSDVVSGLDKISRENFDDGTMRADSVKARYMTGQQYIDYQNEVGTGGRPINQIDPTAVYDKQQEMEDWNFVPYIVDDAQGMMWGAQGIANGPSNFFSALSSARSDWTDAVMDYNGNKISRDSFIETMSQFDDDTVTDEMFYYENLVPAGDDVPATAVPLSFNWFYSDPETGEKIQFDTTSDYKLAEHPDGDGKIVLYFDDIDDVLIFDDYDDVVEAVEGGHFSYETQMVDSRDKANMFAPSVPSIEVDGPNGPVTLGYNDMRLISKMYDDGTLDIDYGPLNIAKDASERSEWTESLSKGDIAGFLGDLVPGSIDMAATSVPLWFPQTAIPQAASGALMNAQGIDRNSYDIQDGTYRRVSDNPSADTLVSSVVGAAAIPLTERIAGGIGHGVLNKPAQIAMSKLGIPAAARYVVDDVGEGVEEIIASPIEELEAYGVGELFADPVLDEDGEVVYGDDYKELRDSSTPFPKRFMNFLGQSPENFISGLMLGSEMGTVPRMYHLGSTLAGNPKGYFADVEEERASDRFADEHGLPKFRKVRQKAPTVKIRPEDIGSFSFEKGE